MIANTQSIFHNPAILINLILICYSYFWKTTVTFWKWHINDWLTYLKSFPYIFCYWLFVCIICRWFWLPHSHHLLWDVPGLWCELQGSGSSCLHLPGQSRLSCVCKASGILWVWYKAAPVQPENASWLEQERSWGAWFGDVHTSSIQMVDFAGSIPHFWIKQLSEIGLFFNTD